MQSSGAGGGGIRLLQQGNVSHGEVPRRTRTLRQSLLRRLHRILRTVTRRKLLRVVDIAEILGVSKQRADQYASELTSRHLSIRWARGDMWAGRRRSTVVEIWHWGRISPCRPGLGANRPRWRQPRACYVRRPISIASPRCQPDTGHWPRSRMRLSRRHSRQRWNASRGWVSKVTHSCQLSRRSRHLL
jgi:hypothetical protein